MAAPKNVGLVFLFFKFFTKAMKLPVKSNSPSGMEGEFKLIENRGLIYSFPGAAYVLQHLPATFLNS